MTLKQGGLFADDGRWGIFLSHHPFRSPPSRSYGLGIQFEYRPSERYGSSRPWDPYLAIVVHLIVSFQVLIYWPVAGAAAAAPAEEEKSK